MRHRKSFNHLGRKPAHRKAMLSNMATSLILKKRISTTTAKAKALRSYVEPLLTKAKDDTTHSRRVVFSYLKDKNAVTELFREISPKIADRPGGYTRILKIGNRPGDNAELAIIELVDYNENMISQKPSKSTSKRRRRGGGGSAKAEETKAAETAVEESAEAVVDETVTDAEVVEETKTEELVEKAETEVTAEETVEEVKTEEPGSEEKVTEEPEAKAEEPKEEPEAKEDTDDKKEEEK